jgi:hypothetical protein
MKTHQMIVWLVGAAALFTSGSATADTEPWTETIQTRIEGGTIGSYSAVPFSVSYDEVRYDSFVFDHVPLNLTHIGKTLVATPSTTRDFNVFANLLTNGINEQVTIMIGSSGKGYMDNDWLKAKGDALKAFKIDSVACYIQSLTITPADNWTNYSGDFVITVNGTIPEPATVSLLVLGAVMARKKRSY